MEKIIKKHTNLRAGDKVICLEGFTNADYNIDNYGAGSDYKPLSIFTIKNANLDISRENSIAWSSDDNPTFNRHGVYSRAIMLYSEYLELKQNSLIEIYN